LRTRRAAARIVAFIRILEYKAWMAAAPAPATSAFALPRAELFRLLGDEDRLRLLALCEEEELTVGELAQLLQESQPQVTKKTQPLREAGLLAARRDGTRTLLKATPPDDAVLAAALVEGRALCTQDGSLARVATLVAQREELSRRTFDALGAGAVEAPVVVDGVGLLPMLPALRPLLPGSRLAVDIGTGEGALLPLLSPLYQRVIAVDRSAARLARCALHVEALRLPNVRLLEADVDDAGLLELVRTRGGADLVVMARVLRHVARPQEAVSAAAGLLKEGGHLVLVDALPHDDERVREQGDVWLGFEPIKLQHYLEAAGLTLRALEPLPQGELPRLQTAVAQRSPAR
jgi:DNA-binding transcriptional ArsR family regulator